MAISYRQILRESSRAVNAVTGVTPAALESAYMTSPLTSTQIGDSNFTISMIIDKLVGTVGQIVQAYAGVPGHPFRAFNVSQTANLANGAAKPSVNSAARPIVGVPGAVRDTTTSILLKRQPIQSIESIIAGIADGSLTGTYHYYDFVEDRIYHTRTNVVMDVCTWDATVELAAVAAGNAPIADACLPIAVAGLVSVLVLDDEFVAQASLFRNYFETALADTRAGKSQFQPPPPLVMGENK